MLFDLKLLRSSMAISDIIGQVVELKQEGSRLKGRCPFHHDSTPSFYVSDDIGRYWCFGCHAKGGIFDFVMEYHGVTLPEAAAIVAGGSPSSGRPPKPAKAANGADSQS